MSEGFWRKLSYLSGLATLLAMFSLLVFMANIEVKDLDLWLHLGMGRHIVQNHFQVPKVDILSFTVAGTPWVNHEWLFQVIIYLIHQLGGFDGLILMQVILVTLTMSILLLLGYNKNQQLNSIFILLLVSLVYQGRFTIRPDLYSLFFFALYIYLLSFHIGKKRTIGILFLIQVLWSNIHGFFFFGPLFVIIGLAAEWVKRKVPLPYEWNTVGRLTNQEYRNLKWILLAVVVACLFNPLTFRGAWYPLGVFFQMSGESRIFFEKIVELKRPMGWDNIFSGDYIVYKVLILLSLLSFFYNRRKLDVGVFVFWLIFLVFSLAAIRNLIFFAFAAYLAYVTNTLGIPLRRILPFRIKDKRFLHVTSIAMKLYLVFWIIEFWSQSSLNGYFDFDKYERKSEYGGVSLRTFPNKAVDFLVENRVKGNFFNDFNSGAYLVGRCFPDIKVFIDGRTEVYGPKFFKYYQQVWEKGNQEEFARMLDKYQITGALLNSVHSAVPEPPLRYLYKRADWAPVYFDYDGVVFLKRVPENQSLIDKFQINLKEWKAPQLDILRIGSQKVSPYPNINRAFTLEGLNIDDAALAEVDAALKVSPNYLEPYKLMGRIYAKRKDFQKAFENFRIAVTYDPHNKGLRMNLALAYYDLGEYAYSAKQYEKIDELWPGDPYPHFMLAKIFVKLKSYDRAMALLKKAHQMSAADFKNVVKVGDLLFKDGRYLEAREAYELVVEKSKKGFIHRKLGFVYQALCDEAKAREEFKKARELGTEDPSKTGDDNADNVVKREEEELTPAAMNALLDNNKGERVCGKS